MSVVGVCGRVLVAADWHRDGEAGDADPLATPNMQGLIDAGIELDNHFAFKFCSPSRSAIQSGRNPIHVNVQNYQPVVWNYIEPEKDTDAGFAGVARNMTTMSAFMKSAGYHTVFAGKWDCGMATHDHTPLARGYDDSLFYFHHDNDYWTSRVRASDRHQVCDGEPQGPNGEMVDLWRQNAEFDGPAMGTNNTFESCNITDGSAFPTQAGSESCRYEDEIFLDFVLDAIESHDQQQQPLFLFWAPHIVHGPLQVPKPYYDKFSESVDDWRRARYLAMVNWLDDAIGNVTAALDAKNMLEDTLLVFTSDNGGPVYNGGGSGANNYPLRGGKTSNFQGGIRVNAFAAGGAIPESMRGRKLRGLGTVWDWLATFAEVAGVDDVTDHRAAAAGLPAIDSVSLWPWLSGKVPSSPRTLLPVGSSSCANRSQLPTECINSWGWGNTTTWVQGLVQDFGEEKGIWKLLTGLQTMDGWQGPEYPNASTPKDAFTFTDAFIADCGAAGCLFRLDTDPGEHTDLASVNATLAAEMLETLRGFNASTFSPDRGPGEQDGHIDEACKAAIDQYGGFFGPFVSQ